METPQMILIKKTQREQILLLFAPILLILAGCGPEKRPLLKTYTPYKPHAPYNPQNAEPNIPSTSTIPEPTTSSGIPETSTTSGGIPETPASSGIPETSTTHSVPEVPCVLKDKLHDEPSFLKELSITSDACIRQLYHSGTIKSIYSDRFFTKILDTVELFHAQDIIHIVNYLKLSNYFLFFDSYDDSWQIPQELIVRYRTILKRFSDSSQRENMSTLDASKKAELADYEFNLIWGMSLATRNGGILEFLVFLMDCTDKGYDTFNQFRAISAIMLDINNFLYISPEPQNSPFYAGVSQAFLEWYVTLFLHPNPYVQKAALFEAKSFSKARPDVAAFIKQKVLEHIAVETDYWTRMWTLKGLYFGFKVREDLQGNPLDIEAEKQNFVSTNMPNVFKIDHITYRTAMSESQIQNIHNQLMAIQEVFFQTTHLTEPVTGDQNPELTVVIVNTKNNYWEYMPLFENIGSNNGGIYIESQGTLYTYERTPEESIYTVEELLNHEYTHYLLSRYIIQGFFGETGTVYDKKIRWFDEGMAEFFAGVDLQRNILLRENLIQKLKNNKDGGMQLDQILTSSDDDDFTFYSYAYTFIYFLYTNYPAVLQEIIRSIAQNDYYFKTYDDNSLTKALAIDLAALNQEYQDFLKILVEGLQPEAIAAL